MGAVVTLDLPEDAPELTLPWIVTFGPLDDDDEPWEPVVCGPYEWAHAISLAQTVVADEELMAVVEPVNPHASVDDIRSEIDKAKATADEAEDDEFSDEYDEEDDIVGSVDAEHLDGEDGLPEVEPTPPPSPTEVRAGFARIASRLASGAAVGAGV